MNAVRRRQYGVVEVSPTYKCSTRESKAVVAVGDTACHGISPSTREARLRQRIHVADQCQTPFPQADMFRRFE